MENMIRVSCVLPTVKPCMVADNARSVIKAITEAAVKQPHVIALPAYVLTGASGGSLLSSSRIHSEYAEAFGEILTASKGVKSYIIFGMSDRRGKSSLVVIKEGEVICSVPADEGRSVLIKAEGFTFAVFSGDGGELIKAGDMNVDVVFCSTALPARVGGRRKQAENCRVYSAAYRTAVVVCNGNFGESSSPEVYSPYGFVCECGDLLSETTFDENSLTSDLDLDIIRSGGNRGEGPEELYETAETPFDFFRSPKCNPYLPMNVARRREVLDEIFGFQVKALADRIRNDRVKSLILNVTGGLDSTLALMVCVKALDELSLPRTTLTGITMPGYGTNDRSYYNALKLIVGFKAVLKELHIKDSVTAHANDVGEVSGKGVVATESMQSRKRAAVLLDLAESQGGMVVGSADITELSLGHNSFAGDSVAHYNVNAALPKTVVKEIINRQMYMPTFEEEADLLSEIVLCPEYAENKPITDVYRPDGELEGPYELHDFFLYYFVRYGFSAKKLYGYAVHTFFGIYTERVVADSLKEFIKRFLASGYKRAISCDGAGFGDISLSGGGFDFPSDIDAESFAGNIDKAISHK